MSLTSAALRFDSPEAGRGKPCGASHIARNLKCHAGAAQLSPEAVRSVATGAALAGAAAGAVALGVAASRRRGWADQRMEAEYRAARAAGPDPAAAAQQRANARDPQALALRQERRSIMRQVCGGIRVDAYRDCTHRIGEASAYGTVYLNKKTNTAFKAQANLRRHINERQHLELANQQGVASPKLYDYNDNKKVIAMEFLTDSIAIRDWKKINTTNLRQRQDVATTLVNEAHKLHRVGIAHGDLHHGNVYINNTTERITFIDFGLSESIRLSKRRELVTNLVRTDLDRVVLHAMSLTLHKKQHAQLHMWLYNRHLPFFGRLVSGNITDLDYVVSIDSFYTDLQKALRFKFHNPTARLVRGMNI